jgi:hypothetical protein
VTVFLFVVLVLTIWRGTHLLIYDELPPVRIVREWSIATFGVGDAQGKLVKGRPGWGILGLSIAYIWTCPWCMSFWVGLGVWGLADWRLSVPLPWCLVAVGSLVSGIGGWVKAEHDQRWELRDRQLNG